MNIESVSLKDQWQALLAEQPKTRIRDAAAVLGVSEAELLATRVSDGVTRLAGDWRELLKQMPRLGRVMCLTRNEAAVHERYGEFRQIDFFHGMGQVVGSDIDLRFFMQHWHYGFAVTDQTKEGERQSFQFFDSHGDAVHKVYLQPESNFGGYGVILNDYRAPEQEAELDVKPAVAVSPEQPDSAIDKQSFQQGWLGLKDTHAFFQLVQKHQLTREQALRLAPDGFAQPLALAAPRQLLENASSHGLPIMVFIGNRGCIQIHTGAVENIKMFGSEWLNVLDADFNMHLRLPLVASAWRVCKPTIDGVVSSVELFADDGELITQFFGKRKPGEPELEEWRALIDALPVLK